MKLSFSTNAYRNFSIEDSIKSISSAGYSAIELMCDEPHAFPPLSSDKIESIKKTLIENQMTISNLNGFMMCAIEDFHHPSWIEKDQIYRQKRIEHTKNCIDLAKELGANTVSTEPGGPPTGLSREEELDIFEQGLNEVLPIAEKNKIKILIEPEPGLLIEKSSQFLDFISRFDSEFIGLNFDVGHFFCVGEDPADLIFTLKEHINHVHLEDIAASREHQHLVPGTGAIDFSRIFHALSEINYDGYVTIELYPYLDNPFNAAQDARNFLNSMANVG
ncbi:MAG: sugar phosphate isomerase/epimerase [Nitrosopumilus sp.]|nr:sugar phosphate isomerase/epimerase [Nitrosopumilus sp.]